MKIKSIAPSSRASERAVVEKRQKHRQVRRARQRLAGVGERRREQRQRGQHDARVHDDREDLLERRVAAEHRVEHGERDAGDHQAADPTARAAGMTGATYDAVRRDLLDPVDLRPGSSCRPNDSPGQSADRRRRGGRRRSTGARPPPTAEIRTTTRKMPSQRGCAATSA